jgi:hypothetical protein
VTASLKFAETVLLASSVKITAPATTASPAAGVQPSFPARN